MKNECPKHHYASNEYKCPYCADVSESPKSAGSIFVSGLTAGEIIECIRAKYFIMNIKSEKNDTTLTLIDGAEVVVFKEKHNIE